MRNQGLGSWTARRARMTPDHTALVHGSTRRSHAELHRRTCSLANALRALGIRRGDRVACLTPNHPAQLETLFACGMLGAVHVPLNTRLTGGEIAPLLRDAGASALVHDRRGPVDELPPDLAPTRIALGEPADGEHHYDTLLADASAELVDEPVGHDEPCLIMYTSGSTGTPKGAVLTHGNLTWNCFNVLIESDLSSDDVALVTAPLFHIAALGMLCLPALLKGATVVLDTFEAGRALETIERERVTITFGVPTMYQTLAAHPRFAATDLSSVHTLLCGGSPVPRELIEHYSDRGLTFVQGYGMTETAPGALLLDREHTRSKMGSAGVPSFFTDVRIVDGDGNPAAPGEKGEVVISGPNVMREYWGRPEATAEALRDGWFHSGDVATADEDGYVHIVDRLKDVLISGGENVYPAEIEQELHAHPQVATCAVIGVPDAQWGEVGRAVVVARGEVQERELLDFLRQRLAGYKVPRSVAFTTDLPTTGSGKLRKTEIRREFGQPG